MSNAGVLHIGKQQFGAEDPRVIAAYLELAERTAEWNRLKPTLGVVDGEPAVITVGTSTVRVNAPREKEPKSNNSLVTDTPQQNAASVSKAFEDDEAKEKVLKAIQAILDSKSNFKKAGGVPMPGTQTVDFMERALYAMGATAKARRAVPSHELALKMLEQGWGTSSETVRHLLIVVNNYACNKKYADRIKTNQGQVSLKAGLPKYPTLESATEAANVVGTLLDIGDGSLDAVDNKEPTENNNTGIA